LESTFKDQINPKRQTAGPQWGSPELDLVTTWSAASAVMPNHALLMAMAGFVALLSTVLD
jgi:hypothetical protein